MRAADRAANLTIAQEDPVQPDIVEMLRRAEERSARLYPAESVHHLPVEALRAAEVRFLVARDANGGALATGAIVMHGEWAEIKRMWVAEDARGQGISKIVLAALVSRAREEGAHAVRLETGSVSHEALGLYRGAGFRECGPFAGYKPDPLSVFMEMEISGQASAGHAAKKERRHRWRRESRNGRI